MTKMSKHGKKSKAAARAASRSAEGTPFIPPEASPAVDDGDDAILGSLREALGTPRSARDLEAVYDVPVQISVVLGRAVLSVSQLLKLGRGAVIELDHRIGEAVDIYVNDRLVARGEVVVIEDRLGITLTEIVKSDRI